MCTRSSNKRPSCGKSQPCFCESTPVLTLQQMGKWNVLLREVSRPLFRQHTSARSKDSVCPPTFFTFSRSQIGSGLRMRLSTIRCFTKAMKYGNKFIYQTVPRLLTIWLDMGEDATVNTHEYFVKISAEISRAISGVPAFKVSRGTSMPYLHLTHPSGIPHFLKSLPALDINMTPSSRSCRI